MKVVVVFIFLSVIMGCFSQRSPYAGRIPIGYPKIIPDNVQSDLLADRFGEDDVSTTTVRLPLEARGDAELVARLSKLPIDQRPFWLTNWQALEERRKNPQTYPQNKNSFTK